MTRRTRWWVLGWAGLGALTGSACTGGTCLNPQPEIPCGESGVEVGGSSGGAGAPTPPPTGGSSGTSTPSGSGGATGGTVDPGSGGAGGSTGTGAGGVAHGAADASTPWDRGDADASAADASAQAEAGRPIGAVDAAVARDAAGPVFDGGTAFPDADADDALRDGAARDGAEDAGRDGGADARSDAGTDARISRSDAGSDASISSGAGDDAQAGDARDDVRQEAGSGPRPPWLE